jgi:hypothetical protein
MKDIIKHIPANNHKFLDILKLFINFPPTFFIYNPTFAQSVVQRPTVKEG